MNAILSVLIVIAFVGLAFAGAKAFMWLVFWLASLVPYIGRKHRHSQWGRDISRRNKNSHP